MVHSTDLTGIAPGPTTLELIRRGARKYTDRIAIQFGEQMMTFAETDDVSSRLAHALLAQGLEPRARVGILMGNNIMTVPIDFACVKANLNRVPLNPRLSVAEHTRMISETHCDIVLVGPGLSTRADELQAQLDDVRFLPIEAADDGGESLLGFADGQPSASPDVTVRHDDVILTLFTSGTTGVLKAAQHTQSSYASIVRNVLLNLMPAREDGAMLHAASMMHASGVFVLPLWLRGGRTVIMESFEPEEFLRTIEARQITAINVVPTMIQMLLGSPRYATFDRSSLRQVIYGASPMPIPVIEQIMEDWGPYLFWQYYGQTESPLCTSVLRPEDHHGELLKSAGQPVLDMEVAITDENGDTCDTGQPGEIVVRSPSAVSGYYNADELTADTFVDGWVHTRDVGYIDEHGYLFLLDRTSDMIITGGYNVYPREVEDVLLQHPAVSEVAVVGEPDETWVESIVAFVVLAEGHEAGSELEDQLVTLARQQLAGYKKPRRFVFHDALPKTSVGKLDRKVLKQQVGFD